MIREAPTTSSSGSNFTDPDSQPYDDVTDNINLTIEKLEQLSNQHNLQVVRHERVNCAGESSAEEAEEMPIVRKNNQHVQLENVNDKGIFSVSRVRKVELSEIPLATDICATRKNPKPVRSSHRREEISHNSISLRDLPHDVPSLMI